MKASAAQKLLVDCDRKGRYVFTKTDLAKILNTSGTTRADTFDKTLQRLVKGGILVRAARNVYVFAHSRHLGPTTIEQVAITLRRGEYVFESLESALSQWGDISQIPIDRITLMTTGRKGEHRTPYGVIEFTHTESDPVTILKNTVQRDGHLLPLATREFARQGLRHTRRNLSLLNESRTTRG